MEASLERKSSEERELSKKLASRGLCAPVPSPVGMSTVWNRTECVATASMHGLAPSGGKHAGLP